RRGERGTRDKGASERLAFSRAARIARRAERGKAPHRGAAAGSLAGVLDGLHDADQAVVAEALELLDRPALGLGLGALDHAVDELLGEVRRLELGPRQLQSRAELLEHV